MATRLNIKPVVLKGLRWEQFRKRLRVRHQGTITALQVTGSVLRVVQTALRPGRAVISRVEVQTLDLPAQTGEPDPVVLGRAIARALERLRLKLGPVVMGIPRASVVLRTVTVPVTDDLRQLASLVHFQVGRDLPFPAEEAVIDFKVRRRLAAAPAPGPGPGVETVEARPPVPEAVPQLEVQVGAVRTDVVEFYQATAAAAGVKLAALGLFSYANARCLDACRLTGEEGAVALVLLRPDEVSIDVIAQQSLLFSRETLVNLRGEPTAAEAPEAKAGPPPTESAGAPPPSAPAPPSAPTTPQSVVDAILIEVIRSLTSYGGLEPNLPLSRLIVAGDTGHEAAMADALDKRLGLPCSVLDPAAELRLSRAASVHAAGAVSAIGLALGVNDTQGLPFDFLHPKRPAVPRDARRVHLMMGAAAAVAVLLFTAGLRKLVVGRQEKVYSAVQSELAAAEKKRPIYARMRQQLTAIQDWSKDERNWLEHLAYLSAVLPASEEVYLTSLTISGQGTLRLAVQARSSQTLTKLEKLLHAAGYDVKPLAVTPGSDKHGYNFRSSVELVVPAKMKVDLTKVRPPARPSDDISLEARGRTTRRGGGS